MLLLNLILKNFSLFESFVVNLEKKEDVLRVIDNIFGVFVRFLNYFY